MSKSIEKVTSGVDRTTAVRASNISRGERPAGERRLRSPRASRGVLFAGGAALLLAACSSAPEGVSHSELGSFGLNFKTGERTVYIPGNQAAKDFMAAIEPDKKEGQHGNVLWMTTGGNPLIGGGIETVVEHNPRFRSVTTRTSDTHEYHDEPVKPEQSSRPTAVLTGSPKVVRVDPQTTVEETVTTENTGTRLRTSGKMTGEVFMGEGGAGLLKMTPLGLGLAAGGWLSKDDGDSVSMQQTAKGGDGGKGGVVDIDLGKKQKHWKVM